MNKYLRIFLVILLTPLANLVYIETYERMREKAERIWIEEQLNKGESGK